MKKILILTVVSFICAAAIRLNTRRDSTYSYQSREKITAYKNKFGFGCSPNLALLDLNDSANMVPLLEGWGNYRMPVTVTNDSAEIYFQQGINMYYGFHIIEALASFDKAAKFDRNFAMAHWGKALSYGPNINDLGYIASPDALESIQKASNLSSNCTPVEKALISAMSTRYSSDSTQTRESLNQLYADAMKKVHVEFPLSADAAALYVDALMVQHPWDLYDRLYKPKPWTPEIVQVLEKLVKQFPANPGANHYYIHAIEGSENPEKGLKIADRLGSMMPGLAHLVHMPSHIYIRSGYYSKGVAVNELAVKGYTNYLSAYPAVANNNFLYIVHNLHMQSACASMDCRYADALKSADETKNSFDSTWLDAGGFFGVYSQYMHLTPYFTKIRFGKWDDILNVSVPPSSHIYSNIMWHYGQGLAFARKHQFDKATTELKKMRDSMQVSQLSESPTAFNPGIAPIRIAEKILQGIIAEEKNQFSQSVILLKQAVRNEDGMLYNEPRDWPHPARQYLGNSLLKAGRFLEAEKIFKEDLKINPNNAWSLTGLAKALAKQHKRKEEWKVRQLAKKALARSDVQITNSVF